MRPSRSSLMAAMTIAMLGASSIRGINEPELSTRGIASGRVHYPKRTPKWTNASFRRAAAKKRRVKAARARGR